MKSHLGVTYNEIDDYLEGKEVPAQAQEKIEAWWNKTQHKTTFANFRFG